jgi:probable phosphoglycerate mutase
MTTFLLLRHGATAHTAERRFSGCTGDNPPLSEQGERQAAALATRLARLPRVDAVLTSELARARRTAELVAAACGLAVQVEADLREIDFGDFEGRTGAEVERHRPAELAAWRASPGTAPPGGESVQEVAGRVAAVRDRWARRHPCGTVLLVSHLYPVRVSALDALGAPYGSVHRMTIEPTSVTEISTAPATLLRLNDAAHLDIPAARP